ncbi:capsid [uncultured virus]|uniref:Capsid n=1 Tax=uncultured virus TaxID=340016 RepID=A0A1D8MJU2_9VIRU|nr:putative capsid [uncultured virus]AUM61921.1 capsid [uncultured virus]
MPRYSIYRGARFYSPFGTSPFRKYRKTYSLRRMSRPARTGGFWPGTRSSFRRVTKYRRIPGWGTIKKTYTIPELKYIDNSSWGYVTTPSGSFTLLNALLQGAAPKQRIGQRINMRSIHLKMTMTGPGYGAANAAYALYGYIRVMLVLDLQPNSQTMTLANLLEDTATGIGVMSSINMDNAARFKVLFDKRYMLTPSTIIAAANFLQTTTNGTIYDEVYLKLSHEAYYADTNAGDITDIKTGALFLVTVGSNPDVNEQPGISFFARLRYTDN